MPAACREAPRVLAGRSSNNFGALRLLFAVLVILAHSSELIDENRSREILTRVFGTLSFGELGVDGFFLISGYLITKSFLDSGTVAEYVLKRVLRIHPGYIVAYLLCVVVLGPLVGGQLAGQSVVQILLDIVFLQPPGMEGVFAGSPDPRLDDPMWTIAYEFRCYMFVVAAGIVGLLSRRLSLAFLIGALLALSATHTRIFWRFPHGLIPYIGAPMVTARFVGVFGCGALFYLYRDRIRYDWRLAALAACGLSVLMFSPILAEAALATLGGYLLFWFAFNVKSPRLAAVGRRVDISYGVYLYAWPVQKSLIWWVSGISPWLVFIEGTAISSLLAFGSWWLVEKPFLNLKSAIVPVVRRTARRPP
jgi:peptidoglycan/LPS O-acetylase OafA/YrhL